VEDQTIKTGVGVNRILNIFLMGGGRPFSEVKMSWLAARRTIFSKLFAIFLPEVGASTQRAW
jgi:hypothetical protein